MTAPEPNSLSICIIGKYPPIQGGVSRNNLWESVALIQRGHSVSMVTNAQETEVAYRTDAQLYDGYVPRLEDIGFGLPSVVSTRSDPRSLGNIPAANPYVSKLAGLATQLIQKRHIDMIVGSYLEPYGVAASLTSSWTGIPFGLRNAGSDVGRLYRHEGLQQTYGQISLQADFWLTSERIGRGLQLLGVDPERLYPVWFTALPPELFNPAVAPLPLRAIVDRLDLGDTNTERSQFDPDLPTIGMYGKIGITKGSWDILAATAELYSRGRRFNLVIVGDSRRDGANRIRAEAQRLGIARFVTVLPFLPPWGVPKFIRACDAVAFLERDFEIAIHSPIVPREVMACGTCLILSNDIAGRVVYKDLLADRRNVFLTDPRNVTDLANVIESVVCDPQTAQAVGLAGSSEVSADLEDWEKFAAATSDSYLTIAEGIRDRNYEMSVAELQGCFARLCTDRAFRKWFELDAGDALAEYDLTDAEVSSIREIDKRLLSVFSGSLFRKRRRAVFTHFPLSLKMAPDSMEQLFSRFYDLHPVMPRQRTRDYAMSFGDFLRDTLETRSEVATYVADIVAYETLELRARASIRASDDLRLLNEALRDHTPGSAVLSAETRLEVAEGMHIGEFKHDVASAVRELRAGNSASFEPGRQILLVYASSSDGKLVVYRIGPDTRQLLDMCYGGISFGQLEREIGARRSDSALNDVVAALISKSIIRCYPARELVPEQS